MEWQNPKYWLILSLIKGLGLKSVQRLLLHFPHAEAIINMPSSQLIKLPRHLRDEFSALQQQAQNHSYYIQAQQIQDEADEQGWQLITYESPQYPMQLKEIPCPPLVLFVKGDLLLLNSAQLAIVGARKASIQALSLTHQWSQTLAERLTITSGLALGIDAAAHQGALANQGKTIAVLAHGIRSLYPRRHQKLAEQIVTSQGALVTEFLPHEGIRRDHFPRRNRIISGLSLGVLLVEAAMKSGSLITAQYALEQNRDVFAVPGSLANPLAQGCHHLIKQGAQLVDHVDDILLHWQFPQQQCTVEEQPIAPHLHDLWTFLPYDFMHFDEIVTRHEIDPKQLDIYLSELQLDSKIEIQGASVRKI